VKPIGHGFGFLKKRADRSNCNGTPKVALTRPP
jgi:hypothetical protein